MCIEINVFSAVIPNIKQIDFSFKLSLLNNKLLDKHFDTRLISTHSHLQMYLITNKILPIKFDDIKNKF